MKEQLEAAPDHAVIKIDVEEVKNDSVPEVPIASGITYSVSPEVAVWIERYNDEVEH
ncbi:MAG: hypothetical protein M3N51_02510 [Actinomycetota bacterium]|nr:hypothetical protein [Actinomycetota bacterium]